MAMAWIQLLLFSLLSFTPLFTLSRSVPRGDMVDVVEDLDSDSDSDSDSDNENICKSICEGVDGELKSCSRKLTEKTDYSLNIEKDLFAVREQLRITRLGCLNSSQTSSVQIAALQNQMNSMLAQLEEKAAQGPSQTVLQKYVKTQKLELDLLAETDPEKIRELQEQLEKSRAELETLLGNLNEINCQTANSSQNLISELLGRNGYLEEKITDTLAECNDLQDNYNSLQEEVDNAEAEYSRLEQNYKNLLNRVDEISEKPDSNLKLTLDILMLIQEINNLENRFQSETSESQRNKLEDELTEKKKQLESKKKESDNPVMKEVLIIIFKLEELWRFQSENLDLNRLDQIQDKKQEVLTLIAKMDDSNLTKIVLKNLLLLSDETHLKKLISDLKQQLDRQIAELQKEVGKKEEELKKKRAELQEKNGNVSMLTEDIRGLREELSNLREQLKDLENTTASQLTDLLKKLDEKKQELEKWKTSLQEKDAELAKNVMKITELLEELRETKEEASRRKQEAAKKIKDLEDELKKEKSEIKSLQKALQGATECTDLEESYRKLKADFQNTVGKLNDSLIYQLFTVRALKQEVQTLEEEVRSSEGNVAELTSRLREKKAEFEKAKKKINKWRRESLRVLDLLEDLSKVNRKQEEHIQEYLSKINRLEKELEDLLTKLETSGNEKTSLSIQVIFLKEQLAKLNKDLARLAEEHQEQNAGLKKEIEEKNKEIAYLQRSGCGTDQLQNQISSLQQELEEKKQELEKLTRENAAQMQELQKQLSKKKRKLEEVMDELKELNSENAELVNRLADLNTQLSRNSAEHEKDVRAAQTRVSELKKQLSSLEQNCSELKDKKAECEEKLNLKQKDSSDLEKENAELKDQLKQKEKKLSDLKNQNGDLEEQLKRKEKELSELKSSETGVKAENERLRDLLATMSERAKSAEKLKEQLKQQEKKVTELKARNADVINENKRLHGDVKELNKRVKTLERSDEQLKQNEKQISELKKENAKLIDEKQNLQKDVSKLTGQVKELEKKTVTMKPPSVTTKSLQFDPNTAHRRLLLSSGFSVRGVQYTINRPDDPRRYDVAIAVLTKTGFTMGRVYWEVQVKERSCFTVGVAAESAARKGNIRYSPSNSYWVMQKKNKQHYLLSDPPFLLHLTDQLNVIGVLIDFTKGEVAFYNARTRALLGVFQGNNFTQKLYPFVATCGTEGPEAWPIELLESSFRTSLPN